MMHNNLYNGKTKTVKNLNNSIKLSRNNSFYRMDNY